MYKKPPMRILFISSTRVGDAILSTGLLDHLIRQNPGAMVTIACGPAAASLFDAVPGLEKVIVLHKMAFSLHWPRLLALTMGRVWDVIVDLRNSPMYWSLPAKSRYRLQRAPEPEHRVRQLARTLGLEDNPPPPRLWTNAVVHHIDRDISDMIRRLDRYTTARAKDLAGGTFHRPYRTSDRRLRHPARRPGGGAGPRRRAAGGAAPDRGHTL